MWVSVGLGSVPSEIILSNIDTIREIGCRKYISIVHDTCINTYIQRYTNTHIDTDTIVPVVSQGTNDAF